MAWLDDRVWCHPKLADLSDRAFRVWVNGIAYSTGFGTQGRLTPGQQRTVGANKKVTGELVAAGLWLLDDTTVIYHEWDEKNGKRDARRAADRERKRLARSVGTSAGQSSGNSTVAARVDSSEGSEGSEKNYLKAVPADQEIEHEVDKILRSVTNPDEGSKGVILSLAAKLPLSSVAKVRESCQTRKVGAGYAVRALQSELADLDVL